MGRNARTGAGAAGGGVGGSHKRISAMIDIQKSALRAFKQDVIAAAQRLVQEARRCS